MAWSALIQINGPSFGYFFGAREKGAIDLGILISVGIGGIQGYLAPLFNGEIADLPFETRCLIVKADPAQLLDQARPVTRQWLRTSAAAKTTGFLLRSFLPDRPERRSSFCFLPNLELSKSI